VDDAVRIDDQSALATIYDLLWREGLFLGGSVGINVAAAVETARRLGPGHTIVTVLLRQRPTATAPASTTTIGWPPRGSASPGERLDGRGNLMESMAQRGHLEW